MLSIYNTFLSKTQRHLQNETGTYHYKVLKMFFKKPQNNDSPKKQKISEAEVVKKIKKSNNFVVSLDTRLYHRDDDVINT